MLLVVTNSADQTADYLCARLSELPLHCLRLDTDLLDHRVRVKYSSGHASIDLAGSWTSADQIAHVWFRRPKRIQSTRSSDPAENAHIASEIAESVEGFLAHIGRRKWMNHPADNLFASHKMEQLSRASAMGLKTPASIVSTCASEVREFRGRVGRIVVKPLSSGWIDRGQAAPSSIIYTSEISDADLDPERVAGCPTLYQERIQKYLDVRAIVVDGVVSAVAMQKETDGAEQILDIRRDNMSGLRYWSIELPSAVSAGVTRLIESYSLRFGAVDLALDCSGQFVFFELNPNGQWAWLDIAGGTEIWRSFGEAFAKHIP